MDTNDDKSSNEELQRVEDLSETTVEPQPVMQDRLVEKKSKTGLVLGVLLGLALVACAVLGWMWFSQTSQVASLKEDLRQANAKNDQLVLAQQAQSVAETEQPTESDAIIAAALAYASAPVSSADTQFTAEIKKQVDGFAGVSVSSDESGFGVILKLVNEKWVVVDSGQDGPKDEAVEMYGIPTEVYEWE